MAMLTVEHAGWMLGQTNNYAPRKDSPSIELQDIHARVKRCPKGVDTNLNRLF